MIVAGVGLTSCDADSLGGGGEVPVCLTSPTCDGHVSVHEDPYYDIHARRDCTAPSCHQGVVTTCAGCSRGECTGCESTRCPSGDCNPTRDGCGDAPAGGDEPAPDPVAP